MAKGPNAFRTISEAADILGVPAHVLRFWETRFSFLKPLKRAGGRRFYRPQDLDVLRGVLRLLREQGYTIRSVQEYQRRHGVRALAALGSGEPSASPPLIGSILGLKGRALGEAHRGRLVSILGELATARGRLAQVLGPDLSSIGED